MNSACEWVPAARMIALTTAIANRTRLMMLWPGSLIGRPGRISWSLPKAMFEPQKEIEPTIAANSVGISTLSAHGLPPL